MVLWQGKDGEPGLDVSNTCIKYLPITIDAPSSITARILLFFLCTVMHVTYIAIHVGNMKYTTSVYIR